MSSENTTIDKNFYTVKENRFRIFVKAKTEDSKELKGRNDKIYHYEERTMIGGFLQRVKDFIETAQVEGKEKEWRTLAIDLKDKKGNYECIQMYFDGSAAESFLKRLPNIDLLKEVFIHIRKDKRGEEPNVKYYDRLDVYQNDENGEPKLVPYFWNKENPLPKWVELKGKGKNAKSTWDKSETHDLFEACFNEKNAQIADIRTAKKDGATDEQIKEQMTEGDFGPFFNYSGKKEAAAATVKEQATERGELMPAIEDDLPF